jgi:hypothetical protein
MSIHEDKPAKIGGYDRYEVESAVRTMEDAAKIKDDSKFLAVVIAEMDKKSDRLDDEAKLLKKVGKKLKSIHKVK